MFFSAKLKFFATKHGLFYFFYNFVLQLKKESIKSIVRMNLFAKYITDLGNFTNTKNYFAYEKHLQMSSTFPQVL